MAARVPSSANSLIEATRNRARYSGHGHAIGAAGYISDTDDDSYSFLGSTGETSIFNPRDGGFPKIRIGAAWDNEQVRRAGFFGKLLKKARNIGVDLDLGCLYELQNGERGCIQAFGENYGAYDREPYVRLSGDERTGDTPGDDEIIAINGAQWPEIKHLLVYMYIYGGAENWAEVKPQIQIRMPDEKPVIVTLHTRRPDLPLCAVAGMENVRGGIRVTNHTEYFPGHAEMDRAFGFGIDWEDGVKAQQR
jgi:tellurite resistance protein TerA